MTNYSPNDEYKAEYNFTGEDDYIVQLYAENMMMKGIPYVGILLNGIDLIMVEFKISKIVKSAHFAYAEWEFLLA